MIMKIWTIGERREHWSWKKLWLSRWMRMLPRYNKEMFWYLMLSSGGQNIILFIGDGMSLPTVAAARTYKSQQKVRKMSISYLTLCNYVLIYVLDIQFFISYIKHFISLYRTRLRKINWLTMMEAPLNSHGRSFHTLV